MPRKDLPFNHRVSAAKKGGWSHWQPQQQPASGCWLLGAEHTHVADELIQARWKEQAVQNGLMSYFWYRQLSFSIPPFSGVYFLLFVYFSVKDLLRFEPKRLARSSFVSVAWTLGFFIEIFRNSAFGLHCSCFANGLVMQFWIIKEMHIYIKMKMMQWYFQGRKDRFTDFLSLPI